VLPALAPALFRRGVVELEDVLAEPLEAVVEVSRWGAAVLVVAVVVVEAVEEVGVRCSLRERCHLHLVH
jgi:hypothetical protein